MEFQPGQLRHEVELGWPDVPERDGHPIVSAFDEPEMMRDEPLTRDVVLVDPPVKLAGVEHLVGLAGRQPSQARNSDLDDE